MILAAFAAMAVKYGEVVLSLRYRKTSSRSPGTAMSYLVHGIGGRGGGICAGIFAVLCLLAAVTVGSTVQANAISESMTITGLLPAGVTGCVLVVLALSVVLRGGGAVSRVVFRLVPFMTGGYLLLCFLVIFRHIAAVPAVCLSIFRGAFSGKGIGGGLLYFLTSPALRAGVSKGLLSNEAGCGTAPMAHATSDTAYPARQGLYGILEVFTDTVLLCTLTAFSVLTVFPEGLPEGLSGMSVLTAAFQSVFGAAAPVLLAGSIAVFAFATILCWGFYLEKCMSWFTSNKKIHTAAKILYCFLLLPGAILPMQKIFQATDLVLAAMTALNLFSILWLAREVQAESRRFGLLPPAEKKDAIGSRKKGKKESVASRVFSRESSGVFCQDAISKYRKGKHELPESSCRKSKRT